VRLMHEAPSRATRYLYRAAATSVANTPGSRGRKSPSERSARGLSSDQVPIGIARGNLAGERPDVHHFLNSLRITGDDRARTITGRGDKLADELHGHMGGAVLQLGLQQIGLVDADKALVDDLAARLTVADGAGEPVEDLLAQQRAERLAIAFGKGRYDHLVGLTRTLDETFRIEAPIGTQDRKS